MLDNSRQYPLFGSYDASLFCVRRSFSAIHSIPFHIYDRLDCFFRHCFGSIPSIHIYTSSTHGEPDFQPPGTLLLLLRLSWIAQSWGAAFTFRQLSSPNQTTQTHNGTSTTAKGQTALAAGTSPPDTAHLHPSSRGAARDGACSWPRILETLLYRSPQSRDFWLREGIASQQHWHEEWVSPCSCISWSDTKAYS